ncbi:hypothetical protein [Methylobacterium brachythecii]|uniref:Uncharacterized protein n=1 Tax=Methylobacterium brachythecii TaxID=1176177 RepID=A0A7W6ALM9_9HYPH|nr:hypothetical protein [Methylobacterium brachythecii]MBB3904903.1 hypothetical protein [Methylobacterium brachythecii]GLS46895.1 hypothetical protein GCM10007884_48930 [Methylobacterium brachythecii]
MSIHTPGTHENIVLAQNVNGRLRAESRIIFAKAFLYRALGAGAFILLAGAGIGAASYGYAYMNQFDSAAEKIASAMQTALSDVTLKTKGEVTLTDNVLKLEQPVVASKPDIASVVAKQAKGEDGNAAVRTTFTVFKTVPYLDGNIVSGWTFKGDEKTPEGQYCYFTHPQKFGSDVMVQVNIAVNKQIAPQTSSEMNLQQLAKSCIWFDPSKV